MNKGYKLIISDKYLKTRLEKELHKILTNAFEGKYQQALKNTSELGSSLLSADTL